MRVTGCVTGKRGVEDGVGAQAARRRTDGVGAAAAALRRRRGGDGGGGGGTTRRGVEGMSDVEGRGVGGGGGRVGICTCAAALRRQPAGRPAGEVQRLHMPRRPGLGGRSTHLERDVADAHREGHHPAVEDYGHLRGGDSRVSARGMAPPRQGKLARVARSIAAE